MKKILWFDRQKTRYFIFLRGEINNFWQTSGLNVKQNNISTINEVFTAKTTKAADQKMDSYVSQIGDMMKKYRN